MPYMQCGLENFNKTITLNSKLNQSNQTSYVTVCASWKVWPKIFKFFFCNPCQSSPSLAVLFPFWFIIISLALLYLSKRLFSGSLQLNCNFVLGQNNSKYHYCAPLKGKENMSRQLKEPLNKNSSEIIMQFCLIISSLFLLTSSL